MSKILNATKKLAIFQQVKDLRRTLANDKSRRGLEQHGTLAATNQQYRTLQAELIRQDTEIRKDRAEASVLSKAVIPATFVPFDPQGSGFVNDIKSQVDKTLTGIFGGPSNYVSTGTNQGGQGEVLGAGTAPTQDFYAGLSDIVNQGVRDRNTAVASATANASSPGFGPVILIGGGLVVLFLLLRK